MSNFLKSKSTESTKMTKIPIIIHGVTGRMGQVALNAVQKIISEKTTKINNDLIQPVAIGLARNADKLKMIADQYKLEHYFTDLEQAIEFAEKINPQFKIYHNTISTGIRKEIMVPALEKLSAATTAVFMEKPIADNYANGLAIVNAIKKKNFFDGVVHHMLEAPGVKKAIELMPEIKPFHVQIKFGYEVAPGFGEKEYCCQRPDFNWTFVESGGGIILDMCHEGYISKELFGETERLSATARLHIAKRVSYDREGVIECNVEDYADIRREHSSGVVNTSVWSWYRRINSEFGPLEITVEGENGSLVFGLYGLKVQWKETAPLLLWEKSLANLKIKWRDHWQYLNLPHRDPFAVELADFIIHYLKGEKYSKNATHALNVLGEVEALYNSAAQNGLPIEKEKFLKYPQPVPDGWHPERLQDKLGGVIHD